MIYLAALLTLALALMLACLLCDWAENIPQDDAANLTGISRPLYFVGSAAILFRDAPFVAVLLAIATLAQFAGIDTVAVSNQVLGTDKARKVAHLNREQGKIMDSEVDARIKAHRAHFGKDRDDGSL